MEKCSYFIEDKAFFGSFPSQDTVNILEKNGVRYFIDLTIHNENKTSSYTTKYNYIKYPIKDRKIPDNWKTFAKLVLDICDIVQKLKENEKIYIHCKGGHGRSGILVACILCQYYNITVEESLKITNDCHSKRKEMREIWRKIGSPQGKKQKEFVRKFYEPLILQTDFYDIDIIIKKSSLEKEYLYKILYIKFLKHENIKNNLLNTGLRPIVKTIEKNNNIIGDTLVKIRNFMLINNI